MTSVSSPSSTVPYDVIIGLEVHVQLQTRTKLFCRCNTQFGAAPNTQTCPVCIGMPGALPVMNRQAFQLALRTAVALNCEIPSFTKWDRKNYYYPDLPKGYQISQFDLPMSQEGHLEISDPQGQFPTRNIRIIRAHLEEDAGKSMHDEVAGRADSRIDLNRTGTPLLEIVSYPDLRSPQEAKAYLNELKLLLTYLSVSDCNMQEGSLRVDANVNLHLDAEELGLTDGVSDTGKVPTPIVEIKNMNSFRAVERALQYETERQFEQWQETGRRLGDVPKQTRGWDDQAQITRGQRHKEESSDYRYFPDPDLVPIRLTSYEIETARQGLGELPAALRDRLQSQYGLDAYSADVMVNQGRELVDYYEALTRAAGDPKRASNWVQQDVLRTLNEQSMTIGEFPVSAERLGELLKAIADGEVDNTRAKDVFAKMFDEQLPARNAMDALGIVKVDASALEQLCQSLLEQNPQVVADFRSGKKQAIGALIGQAKKVNPNANPAEVRETLARLIDESRGES